MQTLLASAAARETAILTDAALQTRANELVALGFRPLDALHIAGAECASADALLTTNNRLLRLAARSSAEDQCPLVRIANPLAWLTARLAAEESGGDDA